MPDDPGSPAGLRPCVWTEHLGPDYVKIAFRAAAAADPRARLVVNDYDLEFAGARSRFGATPAVTLVASGQLLDIYTVACELAGIEAVAADADAAVRRGLFAAAREILA